jgi:hypothetical protein
MSLRLPLIDESGGPLYTVFRWTRHSRARRNPDLFPTALAWIPAFAGMTESN